ncbi:MAG: type II secretion system F family protein, partial [Crocinitomicaceae bacterium]|nr:type II secretion system F family protein [Crocinitomicaceae bacterium]
MSFRIQSITAGSENDRLKKESDSKKGSFLNRDIQFFSSFNEKKKERFYMDLRTLLIAGIDLKSALELIIEEQPKEKDKEIFNAIHKEIIRGKSLADALKNSGKFSEYEYFSIEIGEESNRLNEVLEELMN